MPFAFKPNQATQANIGPMLYELKELLKTHGWVVETSGDGIVTYSANSDVITSPGAGSGGMSNGFAWFVIRQPDLAGQGNRRWCFQHGSTTTNGRWKYSHNAPYTSGSPSATVTPTIAIAADDRLLVGGGTDASPTFTNMWVGGNRCHIAVETGGLGFWVFTWPNGGGNPSNGFFVEKVLDAHVSDTDPYVMYVGSVTNTQAWTVSDLSSQHINQTAERIVGYMGRGTAREAFTTIPMYYYANAQGDLPLGLGANAHDSRDNSIPCFYGRTVSGSVAGSPAGMKGRSRFFRWVGSARSHNDTLGSLSRIVLRTLDAEWDGATTPVL